MIICEQTLLDPNSCSFTCLELFRVFIISSVVCIFHVKKATFSVVSAKYSQLLLLQFMKYDLVSKVSNYLEEIHGKITHVMRHPYRNYLVLIYSTSTFLDAHLSSNVTVQRINWKDVNYLAPRLYLHTKH